MTTRPDDEMESREYSKSFGVYGTHETKVICDAYLAGLLAERARGMGTGDDERDAEAWRDEHNTNESGAKPWTTMKEAFLAGRKGMVPASEVERLKAIIRSASTLQDEAVKRATKDCKCQK